VELPHSIVCCWLRCHLAQLQVVVCVAKFVLPMSCTAYCMYCTAQLAPRASFIWITLMLVFSEDGSTMLF
jgi:hypothetical protein